MSQLESLHESASGEKSRLMRLASTFTLAGVTFLILLKLGAWYVTDSVSMLSSLVDSGMDVLASLVNFGAIRYALQPPDKEHRFGHGKVEYIAGMGQAAFISVTAFYVMIEALGRFSHPVEVSHGPLGISVMLVSIAVTMAMVAFQRYTVRKTGSMAVKADSVHYVMDVLANIAVIISFLLATQLDWHWADPVFAVGIAFYILFGAWEVGSQSFQNLMDREFEDDERLAIERVVLRHPEVRGLHELKTRRSGLLSFIQFHIDLDASLSFPEAHDITEEVEAAIQELHPHAEVLIHTDPV